MAESLIYTGVKELSDADQKEMDIYPYLPSDSLRNAVNLAIYLNRPLLLKGEPGSGKTRLASAVAYEFGQLYGKKSILNKNIEDTKDVKLGWPFYFWSVKSTSKAQDGLYTYDAVGRLRDAQLEEEKDIEEYIEFGPLGKAFKRVDCRPIVLIDEIDKADIDFPNDLLIEIEDHYFRVKETNEEIRANREKPPIIFITSNDEKDLPDAFLRRCLFYYIEFPDKEQLRRIIDMRYPERDPRLTNRAISQFITLRQELIEEKGEAGMKVSTSELIDWVQALHQKLADEPLAVDRQAKLDNMSQQDLLAEFESLGADRSERFMLKQVLELLDGRLPHLGVLLKDWDDYRDYLGRVEARENRCQERLEEFLGEMKEMLQDDKIRDRDQGAMARDQIRAKTVDVLKDLDAGRNRKVLDFLWEKDVFGAEPVFDLNQADLTGASLGGSNLRLLKLGQAKLVNVDLSDADLTACDLTKTDLTGADLTNCDLTEADLTEANLTRAALTQATLMQARLDRTILRGADLSQSDLRGATLLHVKYDTETKWPEGFDPEKPTS